MTSSALVATTTEGATASQYKFSPQAFIRVASTSAVYVEGIGTCKGATCQRLLRTTDNGESFAVVTTPPTPNVKVTPYSSWDQIVFANVSDGFALAVKSNNKGVSTGSVLYATRNGAQTWEKMGEPVGDFLSSIAVTSNTLYGVTTHCSKQPDGNEGCLDYRLVHSSFSTKHWTGAAIPNGRSYAWGFLGNVAAYGPMVWMSEGAKWSLLVSSNDHGAALSARTPKWPALASVAGCDLTAYSTTALWSSCPTGMEVSFAFSDDGGAKWTTVPTKQFMGTGGGFFDPVSSSLAFLDYGGSRAPLFRISDFGRDMTRVGTLQCSSKNSSVGQFVFTTQRNGLAICSPDGLHSSARLVETTDGGDTWNQINPGSLADLRA